MGLFDMAAALLISRTYCPWGGWTSLGIQISFPMFLVLYLDSEGAIASFREACRQSGNADNMPIAEARHPSDVPQSVAGLAQMPQSVRRVGTRQIALP